MDSLDVSGYFWTEENPNHRVPGRLTFDTTHGGELHLIGSLIEMPQSGSMDFGDLFSRAPTRILGNAGSQVFTLEDCHCTNASMHWGLASSTSEDYRVTAIISGAYFNHNNPLEFHAVSLQLRQAEYWVDQHGTVVTIQRNSESNELQQILITITPQEDLTASTRLGVLRVSLNHQSNWSLPVRITTEERHTFILEFDEPQSLRESVHVCSALQDLLTLCLDRLSHITQVSLRCENGAWCHLYMQLKGDSVAAKESAPLPHDTLFQFAEIGELAGVARWIDLHWQFNRVIGTLMSGWYRPDLHVESRFYNALTATEALIRMRLNRPRFNLARQLETLASSLEPSFGTLVGDLSSWARRVVRVRDNDIVHWGLNPDMNALRVALLSDSLYFLVVLSLMRECGVADEALARVQTNRRFLLLQEQLRGVT